jgi:hypothetical protein
MKVYRIDRSLIFSPFLVVRSHVGVRRVFRLEFSYATPVTYLSRSQKSKICITSFHEEGTSYLCLPHTLVPLLRSYWHEALSGDLMESRSPTPFEEAQCIGGVGLVNYSKTGSQPWA